jgi:Lrp/AsnC family leucine-responsive transcriptional regulator
MADFDDIDLALIELLQKDARTPQAQLAAQVGLAASSVNERIRKLGERGLITGYHARISPDVFGYDLLAFVYVGWSRPETEKAFLKKVLGQSTVMEIHHVTGTWNYMLKVRVKNTRMLEGLLAKVIKAVPGVERTETIIVLSSIKESAQIPTREPEWMESAR